jgi:hydrogenase maturation factor
MKTLPAGKINADILSGLISNYTHSGGRVVLGSAIGEDATVIDMGTHYLIAKTDPVTAVTQEAGYYAVNVNANDIASMGGTPLWFLAAILVPENTAAGDLDRVFSQISAACRALGISYCGGHTEVTSSVTNTVVNGLMLGEVKRSGLKSTAAARAGDDLILTKWAAIEATSIMARRDCKKLLEHFPEMLVSRARDYLYNPGISVVEDARAIAHHQDVHALHDPTEGGIATGIFEMAQASRVGVEVYYDRIPISPETMSLCMFYDIDPLGTFASGSLLVAAAPSISSRVIADLTSNNIKATVIGRLLGEEQGLNLIRDGRKSTLPVYHQDELLRVLP